MWIIQKSLRKTNYVIKNNKKLAVWWYMVLYSDWLLSLKNWSSSTISGKGFIISLKRFLTQMLSCEICKRFKSNYFEEHLWMSAAKLYLKWDSNADTFSWILWVIQGHLFCGGSTNGWFGNTIAGFSLR